LQETLKLELSQENMLITYARMEVARFLVYEIVTLDDNSKHDRRGQRCINGAPGLKVPTAVHCKKWARNMRRGKPIPLAVRLYETDLRIITK
jgi:hypothetical protein